MFGAFIGASIVGVFVCVSRGRQHVCQCDNRGQSEDGTDIRRGLEANRQPQRQILSVASNNWKDAQMPDEEEAAIEAVERADDGWRAMAHDSGHDEEFPEHEIFDHHLLPPMASLTTVRSVAGPPPPPPSATPKAKDTAGRPSRRKKRRQTRLRRKGTRIFKGKTGKTVESGWRARARKRRAARQNKEGLSPADLAKLEAESLKLAAEEAEARRRRRLKRRAKGKLKKAAKKAALLSLATSDSGTKRKKKGKRKPSSTSLDMGPSPSSGRRGSTQRLAPLTQAAKDRQDQAVVPEPVGDGSGDSVIRSVSKKPPSISKGQSAAQQSRSVRRRKSVSGPLERRGTLARAPAAAARRRSSLSGLSRVRLPGGAGVNMFCIVLS